MASDPPSIFLSGGTVSGAMLSRVLCKSYGWQHHRESMSSPRGNMLSRWCCAVPSLAHDPRKHGTRTGPEPESGSFRVNLSTKEPRKNKLVSFWDPQPEAPAREEWAF